MKKNLSIVLAIICIFIFNIFVIGCSGKKARPKTLAETEESFLSELDSDYDWLKENDKEDDKNEETNLEENQYLYGIQLEEKIAENLALEFSNLLGDRDVLETQEQQIYFTEVLETFEKMTNEMMSYYKIRYDTEERDSKREESIEKIRTYNKKLEFMIDRFRTLM